MRYYAINQADSLAATSGLSMFSRLLHNWRARRRLAKLKDLDDRLLGARSPVTTEKREFPLSEKSFAVLFISPFCSWV